MNFVLLISAINLGLFLAYDNLFSGLISFYLALFVLLIGGKNGEE